MADKRTLLVTLETLERGMTRVKKEYLSAIAKAGYASFEKSDVVPTPAEARADVMYLVRDNDSGVFAIWALVDGNVERFGDTDVDLDGYVTRDELPDLVKAAVVQALTEDLVANDDEVAEMLDEVFGSGSAGDQIASDEEVEEMLHDVFGY